MHRLSLATILIFCLTAAETQAHATASDHSLHLLKKELEKLKEEHSRISDKIEALQSIVEQAQTGQSSSGQSKEDIPPPQQPVTTRLSSAQPATTRQSQNKTMTSSLAASQLTLSGDVRMRYEGNFGDRDRRDRNRGVMRARLRALYEVSPHFAVGAGLVTGDADDPNTADLTISSFVDDIEIALDQAWMRYQRGGLIVTGGKFPNPFHGTDLVWDGDVNPQGVSASYEFRVGAASIKTTGLYFLIDEDAAGPESTMAGEQVTLDVPLGDNWRIRMSQAFYDYELKSIAGADEGDFRSNVLNDNRQYVSDFNLANATGELAYAGLGERWTVRLLGDYVTNLGASHGEDTGYGASLILGRGTKAGDLRVSLGHQRTEADAVLAAFSHDNFAIATNYKAHSLSLDYLPIDHLLLNATIYSYRPLDPAYANANTPDDWMQRIRLNATVDF